MNALLSYVGAHWQATAMIFWALWSVFWSFAPTPTPNTWYAAIFHTAQYLAMNWGRSSAILKNQNGPPNIKRIFPSSGGVKVLLLLLILTACTVNEVLDTINVASQVAGEIGAALGPLNAADAAIVENISGIASAGVIVIQNVYQQYEQSGAQSDLQKVLAAVGAAKANLSQALAAAHITDPQSQATVTKWANLLFTCIDAIADALQAAPATNVEALARPSSRSVIMPLGPQQIVAAWSSQVCGGEARCSKLVHVPKHGLAKLF